MYNGLDYLVMNDLIIIDNKNRKEQKR